jgi:hypothetical protein
MDEFFEKGNGVCTVKYFKYKNDETYDVKIRHSERKEKLYGIYTIPEVIKKLQPKKVTAKQLEARIKRTEEALEREHIKNVEITSRVGWGAGMRRVKLGPSGRRERELESRLEDYRKRLKELVKDLE